MILVTGSTGTIGQAVVHALLGRAVPIRCLTRGAERARSLLGSDVEVVVGALEDEASLRSAMAGVEEVFVLSPIHPNLARWEGNVVAAAQTCGVGHIVKLSTAGVDWVGRAGPVPTLWALHRQSEEQIEQSGLRFTHLRPDACMQNILMFAAAIATGVYPAPTGEGRRAWVDVRDVAAVAAVVLTEPGHDNRSYELTGPEALSDDDVAANISTITGRGVKHVNPPIDVARKNMVERGMPVGIANMLAEVMVAIAAGRAGKVSSTVAEITGQAPRSFDAFITEFQSNFVASKASSG